MGIVRTDKRAEAIATMGEIRDNLQELLRRVDSTQAALDELELDLGLTSEGVQAARDQCLVMHYRRGEDVGHTLDECTEKCYSAELTDELAGKEEEGLCVSGEREK